MGLTLIHTNAATTASGATPVTITIPSNSAVGLLAQVGAAFGLGYFQGSVIDSGGNTYVAAGGINSPTAAQTQYSDAFYCLNTGSSATTITYTPSASYTGQSIVYVAAWVWTASAGVATFGSQSSNAQNSPGSGTDAITTGSVTCAAGSVVMGFTFNGGEVVSVGTGFAQDISSLGGVSEHGAFSSNHAATYTAGTGTNNWLSQAMSFGIFSAPVPIAWVI